MKIQVDVTPATKRSLATKAQELGVSVEELARAAIIDIAAKPEKEFLILLQLNLKMEELTINTNL